MNNLRLSKEAQNDMIEIKAYVTKGLGNSDAALATVSENYLVFYQVSGKDVYIDRILYGCRDYIRIPSGDAQANEIHE